MSTPLECPACRLPAKDNTYPGVNFYNVVRDEEAVLPRGWRTHAAAGFAGFPGGGDLPDPDDFDPIARLYVCPCGQAMCFSAETESHWRWFRYDPHAFEVTS